MLTGGQSPEQIAAADNAISNDPGKVETDVKDVFADGNKNGVPVFNVSNIEFNQNMSFGRKRLRFKSGTSAQSYMKQTRYNRPFWIAYTNDKGEKYSRKIK